MKNRYYLIAIWAMLCLSCSKEFLNDCDQESPAFKSIKADFTPSINNNIVSFKNNSVNAESYSWEFGDGTTSTVFELNKSYAYRDTPYTVKLITSRCGGERQSSITKTIDIKCQTKAPEIETDRKTICSGETTTLRLKSPCVAGSTIKWSNGLTTNTINVGTGKYTAQCIASCPSPPSNELEITANPLPIAPVISANTTSICEGQKVNITATGCNGGSIKWSNGLTTNTINVGIGKYSAKCLTSCTSNSSNEIEIVLIPKPNQPSLSGSNFDVCEGFPFTLPNSTCNNGTVVWNDGTNGLSKNPSSSANYTITCNSNGCVSQPSSAFTIKIIPSKATVATLDGSLAGGIVNNNITLRGSIDFKTATLVEEHGFIFKPTLTDTPFKVGDAGVTRISMGSKPSNSGNAFNYTFKANTKDYSYIAYIKDCTGYKYGTIKKL